MAAASASDGDTRTMPPPAAPRRTGSGDGTGAGPAVAAPADTASATPSHPEHPESGGDRDGCGRAAASSHDSDISGSSDHELPENDLRDFDWAELQHRYNEKMKQLHGEEQRVLDEFNQLIGYFSVWADVGSGQEIHRSSKRLKTQLTFVQHEEDELRHRREHYVKVVHAFQSAMNLLLD